MNLPTREEVEQLWDEYRVPKIIRRHCEQVAKVGVFLAKKLKEMGIHVDVGLVERAGLLHDLTRSANFGSHGKYGDYNADYIEFWKQMKAKYGDIHHGDSAADLLMEKYPEVAEVIRAHTFESEASKDILTAQWENKIMAYSDWRVVHDVIVSLKQRLADSKKRHGDFYEKLKKDTGKDYHKLVMENLRKIEEEIFGIVDIEPEEVDNIE